MRQLSLFNKQVRVAVSEAADGNMKVVSEMTDETLATTRKNRSRVLASLGLENGATALMRVSYEQEDYCKFVSIGSAESFRLDNDLSVGYSDGILTGRKGVGIFLPLADCLGLVLFDPCKQALMVVHCGRHTLLQDGASKAVTFMAEAAGVLPENIRAWFSPCAGKSNYPLFDAGMLGMEELAENQLYGAGVLPQHCESSGIDTTTSPDFFSHSSGDIQARFAICATMIE